MDTLTVLKSAREKAWLTESHQHRGLPKASLVNHDAQSFYLCTSHTKNFDVLLISVVVVVVLGDPRCRINKTGLDIYQATDFFR